MALSLSGAALALLAAAPLGWRLGWWPYSFSLHWLMPISGYAAAVALAVSVLTLALAGPQLRWRGVGVLCVTLCASAALVYVPWYYSRLRRTLPPIHDITTDTKDPPAFRAALPARVAESAVSTDYDDAAVPQLQQAAYPDVAPLKVALPVATAFNQALQVARSMPGWTIIAADADTGRIEASQQSRWFRFTDDIVIRVSCDAIGSRIDMRSTSRQGRSDYGVNAARVRAYIDTLRQRLGS
jgi:uncharacterized protein (DUF1499 family)